MKRVYLLLFLLVLVSSCRRAPVIGISSGRSESGAATLSANYTDAVIRAGGVPVIFPTVADSALASTLIRMVDGVIFSGGPDLDPSYYGETVWNETVEVDTLRDVSDLLLMRAQDIPTQVDTMVKHSGGALHRIGVEKGSVLYTLLGEDSLTVNSSHHQAVKAPAPGIKVTARADDGIIEAYEYGDQVIAFQFHPEGMARKNDAWLAPFRYFIQKIRGK